MSNTLHIAVFGATSAIAMEVMRPFARDRCRFTLVARDSQKLEFVKKDLLATGADNVICVSADLSAVDQHEKLLHKVHSDTPRIDVAVVAYGVLGSQLEAEQKASHALEILHVNFTSAVHLLTLLANLFEKQRSGTIAVISSVAGDRGKISNYVYGSAKGGLSVFLQGLRNRMHHKNVHVITIKPGFVDTPMTAGMKKGLLFASPRKVGVGIYRAIKHNKDVAYLPKIWWWIMAIIKAIPESIFKRMRM